MLSFSTLWGYSKKSIVCNQEENFAGPSQVSTMILGFQSLELREISVADKLPS